MVLVIGGLQALTEAWLGSLRFLQSPWERSVGRTLPFLAVHGTSSCTLRNALMLGGFVNIQLI